MKKVIAFLLVTVMALSLFAGCGGDTSTSGTSSSGNGDGPRTDISIAMAADAGTFNPYASSADGFMKVKYNVYQALFYLTPEKELHPVIAESYEQIDDTTYRVKLKENVHDSENNPITAEDVVFSMQQGAAGNMAATFKYSTDEICAAISDYEVEFYFAQQTSYAFTSMMNQIIIIDKGAYEASDDEFVNNPIGTGPYVLTDWVVGSSMTFEQNENYWDDDPYPYFEQNMETITYKVIAEAAQRAIELETGGVDLIYDCQATDLSRFQSNTDFVANQVNSTRVLNIYFNCSEYSNCRDVRMRQAVAYAVDRNAIAVAACEGLGEASMSIAHPVTMEWRDRYAEQEFYSQDIAKAQELVDELAAEGYPLEFSIMTDENATKRAAATIIQEACKQIGVTVEIEQLESAVFQSRYGDLTAWDSYMGQNASQIYTTALMTTQIDRTGYPADSELRTAIDEAFKVYDEATSDTVVELWNEEIPILPLVNIQVVYVYKAGLVGAESLDLNNIIHPGSCSWE